MLWCYNAVHYTVVAKKHVRIADVKCVHDVLASYSPVVFSCIGFHVCYSGMRSVLFSEFSNILSFYGTIEHRFYTRSQRSGPGDLFA